MTGGGLVRLAERKSLGHCRVLPESGAQEKTQSRLSDLVDDARLDRPDASERVVQRLEAVGDLREHCRALGMAHPRPWASVERFAGRCDRALDVRGTGAGDACRDLLR